MVVVVVVGVVCRHLLDAGGDAPHRLHVRLRGRPALCPPPFVPSSPLGSHAPSRLSLGARGALALAFGPLSSPLPVSPVPPPVPHALARSLSHLFSPCPLHLGSLPAPLRALPVPWPLPGPLPRVAPSAACALLPPAAAPFLDHSPGVPLPLQLRQRDARRRALARRGEDVPLPPRGEGLRGERLGGAGGCGWGWRGRGTSRSPCPLLLLRRPPARRPWPVRGSSPACAACWGSRRGRPRPCRGPSGSRPQPLARPPRSPSLPWRPPTRRPWLVRGPPLLSRRARGRGVAGRGGGAAHRDRGRNPSHALLVLLCCRGGRRRGARGPCGVRPPRSRRVGGRGAAGRGGVAARQGRGRSPLRALSALLRCRGGRRRGARGPCGVRPLLPRRAGGRGVVGRGGGAARRGRGRNPSSALLALLCARAAPRVGGVPGAAVGAAAWLAAVSASCASGRGGAAGLAAWAAGAVVSAGAGSRAGGGGPTSTAASASLCSSRSARVSPVHSGEETGERERDRRWWQSSRWGDPSESAITVTLVGMRGGRPALPTTSWCISAVPWAVPCGALRGGGGEGVGGRLWRQPRTAGGLRPFTGIWRGGGGATRPTCRATAPSLGRGPGPWAPGGRRAVSGAAALGGPPYRR